ncbi:hypothetical protein N4G40_13925 [Pantoea eucrina]|uniref:Uncharacterized protein n=1 Tax=Pantoea eucrina TaxID=472693 RepID=A0ABU5LHE1_9GAMM|nr:hypothetical protein [Pantoea eucrina]MDZ7279358.1 hypothetical protein [Pantoea eucrina]
MNINNVIPYAPVVHDDIDAKMPSLPADERTDEANKVLIKKLLWDHSWRVFLQQTTTPPETEEW